MVDLIPSEAAVVVCLADRATLDALAASHGGVTRVAPDELWLVGPRTRRAALLAAARERVGSKGLVVDQSDGWSVWTVQGEDRLEIPRRLMFAAIPDHRPAFVQGAITGVAGKVLYESGRLHLFVPAPVGHHLADRIAAVAEDLSLTIQPAAPLAFAGAGR